jgi:hypothetical protein
MHVSAIADLDTSIILEPFNDRYYLNRGIAHYEQNNFVLACKDWKKAEELGNDEANKFINKLCGN